MLKNFKYAWFDFFFSTWKFLVTVLKREGILKIEKKISLSKWKADKKECANKFCCIRLNCFFKNILSVLWIYWVLRIFSLHERIPLLAPRYRFFASIWLDLCSYVYGFQKLYDTDMMLANNKEEEKHRK